MHTFAIIIDAAAVAAFMVTGHPDTGARGSKTVAWVAGCVLAGATIAHIFCLAK